ncbi:MAG: glycosyltransferase family 39 protein [Acidobacteriia bacterium]|nr:glycosyltransferase family 39 protein [Terriglobia bacterium]
MIDTLKNRRVPVLLFLGVFLFSGLSPVGTSFDSRWTVYIAMSLWNHGDTNLDEYEPQIRESDYYAVGCVDAQGVDHPHKACAGHWYNGYPIGGPVLTAPLIVAAVEIMRGLHPLWVHVPAVMTLARNPDAQRVLGGFIDADYDRAHALIEMEVASLLLAAAAVVIYFTALLYLPSKKALLLALLFALATPAYSVAGRAIWQHTPSMLLLAITIYLFTRAEQRPALAAWAGLPVALSYTVRPTDALFVVIFTAYVAVRHRAYLLKYLLAATPVAIAFLAYNFSIYHFPLSPYYRTELDGFLPQHWPKLGEALAGNLISPSRGLLVYTPVFVFAIWSMIRRSWKNPLAPWLTALAALHWLAISAYIASWWAGMCYGPRFFTDLTPVFVFFLIPYLERWDASSRTLRIAFVTCALIGFAMHVRSGWSIAVHKWNVDPVSVDRHPERNWDWSDPPFLR